MTRTHAFTLSLVIILLAGCKVTGAAIGTAQTAAAGNDRYTQLAAEALAGAAAPGSGLDPISRADLEGTPASVLTLVRRLLQSLGTNRFAWHSIMFQLDEGPDPAELDLTTLKLPQSEDDDLAEED